MASLQHHLLFNPSTLSPPFSFCSRVPTLFPKLLSRPPKFAFLSAATSSAPGSIPEAEKAILDAVVESQGDNLPCVRSFENDLARLTVFGVVDYEQALTAAAADGGQAAGEHLSSGMPAMVVETVFPGSSDDHATVSTRLFLPARKVKEKARKLRSYITEDVLGSINSANILAMTFRQVVMRNLWNFELVTLQPGSRRNMDELGSIREVPASFALSSSDEKVIYVLAEAICILALEGIEKSVNGGSTGKGTNGFFHWASKTKRVRSKDSSVTIYRFENEVVENAKSLLEKFNAEKASWRTLQKEKSVSPWWSSSVHSKLERLGGPEFSSWINEYIPAYKLEIDSDLLPDVKFEGWKRAATNRWEVLLTHSQMVGLANILDMSLEDPYTLPDKDISCSMVENAKLSKNKRGSSLLQILSTALAGAVLLVSLNVVGRLCLPHLYARGRYPGESRLVPTTEISDLQPLSLESSEVDALCVTVIRKIEDSYDWKGDVISEPGVGAWVGKLPAHLSGKQQDIDLDGEDASTSSTLPAQSDELKLSAQNTISYQVVLSSEGRVVGFQPTSRVAVNNWAANPLAKELYGGKQLSPGFLEPRLKISKPNGFIVLELLMSPDFALVRPLQ